MKSVLFTGFIRETGEVSVPLVGAVMMIEPCPVSSSSPRSLLGPKDAVLSMLMNVGFPFVENVVLVDEELVSNFRFFLLPSPPFIGPKRPVKSISPLSSDFLPLSPPEESGVSRVGAKIFGFLSDLSTGIFRKFPSPSDLSPSS